MVEGVEMVVGGDVGGVLCLIGCFGSLWSKINWKGDVFICNGVRY